MNSFQFFLKLETSLYNKSFYMFKHNYYTYFGSRNIALKAMYTSSTSVWEEILYSIRVPVELHCRKNQHLLSFYIYDHSDTTFYAILKDSWCGEFLRPEQL